MKANSRNLLARVHILKKERGLDDDTYRGLLERETGQRSAKGLSTAQLHKVIDCMSPSMSPSGQTFVWSHKPHVRMIRAIWAKLGNQGKLRNPSEAGLRAFVASVASVDNPEFLTAEAATPVIEALKAWERRPAGDLFDAWVTS